MFKYLIKDFLSVCLIAAGFFTAMAPGASAATGQFVLGQRPFSPTSSWNTPIEPNAGYSPLAWPVSNGYIYGWSWDSYSPAVYVSSSSDPIVTVPHTAGWGYPSETLHVRMPAGASGAAGTDGEMLVTVPVSVTFRSGTNLDRIMELVRMDVVRRIAGRGVSPAIDREYRHLRSLESGIRGSSRTASMKLDAAWGYRVLKQEFPFMARLADKRKFAELVDHIQSGRGSAERRLEALIAAEQSGGRLLTLPLDADL